MLRVAAGESPSAATASWCTWRPARVGPPHEFAELASPDEVDALDGPPGGHDLLTAWSWIDEPAGVVRAPAFLLGSGSPRTRPPARRPPSCASSSGARSTSGGGARSRISRDQARTASSRSAGTRPRRGSGLRPALSELLVAHAQDRATGTPPTRNTAAPAMKYAFDTIAVSVPTIRTAGKDGRGRSRHRALSRGSDSEHQHSDDEAERREVVQGASEPWRSCSTSAAPVGPRNGWPTARPRCPRRSRRS